MCRRDERMTGPVAATGLRIRVVLIHHGDEARIRAARETVAAVVDAVQTYGDVHVVDAWRQPRERSVQTREIVSRRVRQWRLERQWARHVGVGRRWILSSGLLMLRLAELCRRDTRAAASRQAFIELSLSAKHVLAWRNAFEDGVDVLIVLEDDARTRSGSRDSIRRLVHAVSTQGLGETYADLAGGLDLTALRLDHLVEPLEDGVAHLRLAATNTACAYLVGREVIALLATESILCPASVRLPADWLMNRDFMLAAQRGDAVPVRSVFSRPYSLSHGSLTGAVPSSIRLVRIGRR